VLSSKSPVSSVDLNLFQYCTDVFHGALLCSYYVLVLSAVDFAVRSSFQTFTPFSIHSVVYLRFPVRNTAWLLTPRTAPSKSLIGTHHRPGHPKRANGMSTFENASI